MSADKKTGGKDASLYLDLNFHNGISCVISEIVREPKQISLQGKEVEAWSFS